MAHTQKIMQKVKVKGHLVQKLEWKQMGANALPLVLTRSVNMASAAKNKYYRFSVCVLFIVNAAMRG